MNLGSFFKRIFTTGSDDTSRINPDPFGRDKAMPSAPPAKDSISQTFPRALLHRDEILDAKSRICGYRFYVCPLEEMPCSGRTAAYVDALKAESIARFAERRLALLPLNIDEWRRHDFRSLIAAHTVFLISVPPDRPLSSGWIESLQTIRDVGARIALKNFDPAPDRLPLLDIASLLLIDARHYSLLNLERLVNMLRQQRPALELIADNVASWPERRHLVSLGVHYCMGGFAATIDEEDKSDRLNQSRLVLIELLNLLRSDAELTELTAIAKRDPGVAIQLVNMANSPLSGMTKRVGSLEQAIMVVGRDQLYRWLTLSLFRVGSHRERDEALLELALGRARFMELVAERRLNKQQVGEVFFVGLLSMLDSLLAQPLEQILDRLNVVEQVASVLLRSEGPYAPYLLLALAVEHGQTRQAAELSNTLGLDATELQDSQIAAINWAEEALRGG